MKKKFIESSYQFITKYQKCDDLKIKKIKYGLESLYNLLSKTIVLFILAGISGLLKEFILLLIIYAFTRMFTYGLHAKSTIMCWIITLVIYMGGCVFIKYVQLPNIVTYIIWSIGFVSFLLWAPADTPAHPLIHKEKRLKEKIKACIISIVYLFFIILSQNAMLINAICYALIVQSICINPYTYKITNTTFENYKVYNHNHGLN